MWSSTVGLVNGKHRYLTAETFGFKISSNGQQLKRRQQWTIEAFPENTGPDGSISSAASVSSQALGPAPSVAVSSVGAALANSPPIDPSDPCILTLANGPSALLHTGGQSSSSQAGSSDQDSCGDEHENVAIKSHLNKYLAVDLFGNVTCDSEEKTESARFTITICSMSQNRSKEEHIFWAFKNVERGYYLGTTDDGMLCCHAKMPKSRAELWHLHLVPARGASFFAIKSLGRKRFARVATATAAAAADGLEQLAAQVQLDANISWGPETLFQFQYFETGGKYSLLTSDQRLLTNEGKCISWPAGASGDQETMPSPSPPPSPPPECLFTLEYHSGYLAFRDSFGQYLAAAGRSSVLRSRSIGVSRDELFVFEPAPVQVSLKATFNNRWVSIKQGVDLTANQAEISGNYETFQMTYHKQTQLWSIMTHDCNFWTISQVIAGGAGAGAISTISVCRPGDYEGLTRGQFKLIWSDTDASFSMKYVDLAGEERWLSARKSGQLYLAANNVASTGGQVEPVRFIMRLRNRNLLNLRPVEGSGFVGLRSASSRQLECNKAAPDAIEIEYCDQQVALPALLKTRNNELSVKTSAERLANTEPRVINVFNVRLNQTKMSPSVFDKLNSNRASPACAHSPPATAKVNLLPVENSNCDANEPQLEFGIDANNNSACLEKPENGGVECSSAPSVASIINSFSSAKIRDQSQQMTTTTTTTIGEHLNGKQVVSRSSAVSKLASSFESPANSGDRAHTTPPDSSPELEIAAEHLSHAAGRVDQVAQAECCYMRMKANSKYLVQGGEADSPGGAGIICDATNKACALAWILELRSHNSIAIRASDNHAYMQLGTNGTIYLARCEPSKASLWQF